MGGALSPPARSMEPLPRRIACREVFDEPPHVARANAYGARAESDQRNPIDPEEAECLVAAAQAEQPRGFAEGDERLETLLHDIRGYERQTRGKREIALFPMAIWP